jgi:hypothetical protein
MALLSSSPEIMTQGGEEPSIASKADGTYG